MKRLITVLAAAIACCLFVSCKDDKPPVIASRWMHAPETIVSGDTMKVFRTGGEEKIVLMNRWRKYEMFNCANGKMTSIGFDSTAQSDTLIDVGWGQWMTVQEKRQRDAIEKDRGWRFIINEVDTFWVE